MSKTVVTVVLLLSVMNTALVSLACVVIFLLDDLTPLWIIAVASALITAVFDVSVVSTMWKVRTRRVGIVYLSETAILSSLAIATILFSLSGSLRPNQLVALFVYIVLFLIVTFGLLFVRGKAFAA